MQPVIPDTANFSEKEISPGFHKTVRSEYEQFLLQQKQLLIPDAPAAENILRVDLHCHDHNSDVPDELWGRLLRLPETWLKTEDLVKRLQNNGCDLITITNHNNARSCWDLLDRGFDVLVGAEFTCHFPDSELSIHVLTYGFTPEQEVMLNLLRRNIYHFAGFCREHALPTVLPHPLFFYAHGKQPDISLLEKFALLFERFEVLNGQRGYWQNTLTRSWIDSLTPERIDFLAREHKLNPFEFCTEPYRKRMTGGSDDHNGIFAGRCGTLLQVDNLQQRLKETPASVLALEALRNGQMAPYGEVGEEEKLTATFLDYFSQVAINMKDPGLLRLMLHKGSMNDKLICLGISNVMQELKRHKYTLTFLETFHQALAGKKPKLLVTLGVSKEFKPLLKMIKKIARTQRHEPDQFLAVLREVLPALFREISTVLLLRLKENLSNVESDLFNTLSIDELIRQFELPTHARTLFSSERSRSTDMVSLNLLKLMDSLTFPALAGVVLAGATLASRHVLYSNREFLNRLADTLDQHRHPERVLWLTDTLTDHNGVSSVLQSTLQEIQADNLPIDMLVCHPDLDAQPHLHVVRPLASFDMQKLGEQLIHIPDLLAIQRIFEEGGYDRIICSTELVMGLVAQYLKHAYSVPAYFFMHTDWIEFFSHSSKLDQHGMDRLRRLIRAFYRQFDGIFVLNSDHKAWLCGPDMGIEQNQVFLTRHWADPCFINPPHLPTAADARPPVILYAGRLSDEKGVMDLPLVWEQIQAACPNAELWIAGSGPSREKLETALPDAHFLGWVGRESLAAVYADSDLLLLPSRFDTFGCVVLEAMGCGVPVIAYKEKGPKDIIRHEIDGFLTENADEMAEAAIRYLANPSLQRQMKLAASQRNHDYQPAQILLQMLHDLRMQARPGSTSDNARLRRLFPDHRLSTGTG